MPGIFISYRREDSAEMCDRLDATLAAYFGRDKVFKDTSAMVSGRDFAAQIQQAIAQSNVALVLIGPQWVKLTGASGARRIDEPEDYVRREIEMARQYGVSVLPVLVRLAPMPSQPELPASLAFLSTMDAAPLRVDPDYPWDAQRLIEKVLVLAPQLTPRFDPVAALDQALRGNVPDGWRVWTKKAGGSRLSRAFIWFIFAAIIAFVLLLAAFSGTAGWSGALVGALVVGAFAAIIGAATGGGGAKGQPWLVLTPRGVAQVIGDTRNSVDFAQVESVTSNRGVGGAYAGRVMVMSTGMQTALSYLMRDGSQQGWVIGREFGNAGAIAQAIIAAHGRYLQSHRGLGVPPLPPQPT